MYNNQELSNCITLSSNSLLPFSEIRLIMSPYLYLAYNSSYDVLLKAKSF